MRLESRKVRVVGERESVLFCVIWSVSERAEKRERKRGVKERLVKDSKRLCYLEGWAGIRKGNKVVEVLCRSLCCSTLSANGVRLSCHLLPIPSSRARSISSHCSSSPPAASA